MNCEIKITDGIYWIGSSDRRLALFENVYPVPSGVSYNSYFIDDEKTAIVDTVDKSVSEVFFENIDKLLCGRKPDFLIVSHMEPDHAGTLCELVRKYPDIRIVCNAKTVTMLSQYFDFDFDDKTIVVKEGDILCTGDHILKFVMAPMVHWPEVMVSYDVTSKVLFSADAFGVFGAVNGNIFADELNFKSEYLSEARRYYTNIVGKYGTQVQALLKKASGLDISYICPLHGPVWRSKINYFLDKYAKWSTYTPEENAVAIFYASVYGHTQNAADIIAAKLASMGIRNIKMYDVSVTHPSYLVAEAFRCSHLVFASTTYNAEIFVSMENLLHDLAAHNIQNRTVAIVENGTWAPTAGSLMKNILSGCKNITFLENNVCIRSAVKSEQCDQIEALCTELVSSMPAAVSSAEVKSIEPNAMFKLSYGLYMLSSGTSGKDNGCIINTVMQVTDSPKRITIAVNKANYSHDIILNEGKFTVSCLSTDTSFELIKRFGFQSGRDADKFDGFEYVERGENGLYHLTKYANAYLSAKVISAKDYGTHTLFVADITEAKVLSDLPSMTYEYYFANVKPKPIQTEEKKKGFVCKICGYFYEGDELPEDFVCPLCKHGAEDFEPLS